MSIRSKIVFVVICLATLAIAYEICSQHSAETKLAEREMGYAKTAAVLEGLIRPGLQRVEVEKLLEEKKMPFNLRSGRLTWDEIVPLAHETSSVWYCSWDQVQVLIEFAPAQGSTGDSYPGYNGEAHKLDTVKDISLDHWAQDCL